MVLNNRNRNQKLIGFGTAGLAVFLTVERLRFTFTQKGKREFVPRDQVIYYFCPKISSFKPVFSIKIVLDSFYLPVFHSEKFST